MIAAPDLRFPWHAQLPRLGTAAEFSALREMLETADYSEPGLCRRFGVEKLSDFLTPPAHELIAQPIADSLDALIRLFFHSVFADAAECRRVLSDAGFMLLESLGLIGRDPAHPGMIHGASAILPAAGLLTVCDRGNHAPDGSRCELPPDVVYPAIFDTTRRFLSGLPDSPCDAMLDIGTGTGIAAMLGARRARHVWATDITPRAALFAEFNCRVAGLDNVTVLAGDMYAPLAGLTFDRIVIHPPYVPAPHSELIFRDAGEDGEQIIRRAIEGLPGFLRPGGRLYALLMASDRASETFEQRLRRWLGPAESEFDIVVGARSIQAPEEFLGYSLARGGVPPENVPFLRSLWRETRTEAILYAALLIGRHRQLRPVVTQRLKTGKGYSGRHLEWLLEWEKAAFDPGSAETLLNARPCLTTDCERQVISRFHNGQLEEAEFVFQVNHGFRGRHVCDPGLGRTVSECDGISTWREHYDRATAEGRIPSGATAEEFAGLLVRFVADGILRVDIPPEYPVG
jgi:carbamoyltransferase